MPYEPTKPLLGPTPDELRDRIPGWGADADPAHRQTWQERPDIGDTGARWTFPDRQPGGEHRERSIEHRILPPVFGTAQPLHGLSGAIRRLAYARLSETKNTRWLLLVLGDRVEATGAHVRSLFSRSPDNPITQTGILAESRHHPLRSRFGRGRRDLRHAWMDPLIVAGPWVAAVLICTAVIRRRSRRP